LDKIIANKNIILDEPLGYLEFTCLMANCKYITTDSGGLQEESTALDIPCFTLRENTERPSTLIKNHGTNQLINKISEIEFKECKGSMDLWDGKSSEIILRFILNIYETQPKNCSDNWSGLCRFTSCHGRRPGRVEGYRR
jgi:UDP-N-acetylglucosamine 2-epimerase (non-hydrolysing)